MHRKIPHLFALGALYLMIACRDPNHRLNQEKAASSLKALSAAEATFRNSKGAGRYGTIKELAAARLIDANLATGIKDGYRFEVRIKSNSFEAVAVPLKYDEENSTGSWSFYVNDTGVVRGGVKGGVEATANDPPLRYQ